MKGMIHDRLSLSAILLGLAAGLALTTAAGAADICGYPEKGTLTVTRQGRAVAVFRVGLAQSGAEHRRGLMGCPRLDAGRGLLFIFPEDERRVFWMKNTPVELAIAFAAADGRIEAIERGEPNSTRRIRSPAGIRYVLEIGFGEAARLRVGDRLMLPLTASE